MRTDRTPARRVGGLTLIELMMSVAVGLVVVLAATALLLSVQRSYGTQDDLLRIDENGRYALELLSRSLRQAGMADPGARHGATGPAVFGADAGLVPRDTPQLDGMRASEIHGSDVLALRHQGTRHGGAVDCAGFGERQDADDGLWSIFYLGRDAAGEPQLYCKYLGEHGWGADAVVGGVESFQVLYGVDHDGDGMADQMLNATAVGSPVSGTAAGLWERVVSVRVALLLRGAQRQPSSDGDPAFDLFGPEYSAQRGASDPGVRLHGRELAGAGGARIRKIVEATIQLRNRRPGAAR